VEHKSWWQSVVLKIGCKREVLSYRVLQGYACYVEHKSWWQSVILEIGCKREVLSSTLNESKTMFFFEYFRSG
jgi:hypothetical protein